MPDPTKVLATIRRAAMLFRATPGRVGSIINLDAADEVLVVGDLHGHLEVFRAALNLADLACNPGRHLVLQELVHDNRIDPDEGTDLSHRLVDVVCALKCQTPDRVHLILGNHELSELTGRSISKQGVPLNNLFRRGVERSYGVLADELFEAYYDLFRSLPIAVRTPNRVMICHTIPDERDLDSLDLDLLKSGEWPPESLARRGTVYALTWGRDTSQETADRFAELMDADLFVIGHHACEEGFRRANDRTLILDGTDPSPHACLFNAKEPAAVETLLDGVRLLA
jgi:hypothetical protein